MRRISDEDVVYFAAKHQVNPAMMFPRESVRDVGCPHCGALPGMPCIGWGGRVRIANHLERCFERIRLAAGNEDL